MRLHHLLVAVLLHVSASAGEGRLPDVIRHKHNPAVLAWVDESAAFDANGRLREDVAAANPSLERILRFNRDGRCKTFMVHPDSEHFLPDKTMEDIASSSLIALSGNVVHISRGFFNRFPGTLVGFRVTEKLGLRSSAGPVQVERGDIRYTFIAAAQFLTPDGAICSRPARPVPIPRPGDEILIFAYVPPIDAAELIIPVDSAQHLVIERGGSRIFTPVNLADGLRGLSIPEAIGRVAAIAKRVRSAP